MSKAHVIVNSLLEVADPDAPEPYVQWLSQKADIGPLEKIRFGAYIYTSDEDMIRENAAEQGIDVDSQAFWDEIERCLAVMESNCLQILRESGLHVSDEGHDGSGARVASVWIDTPDYEQAMALVKGVINWAEGDWPSTTSGTMDYAFGANTAQRIYQNTEDAARFIDVTIEFTGTDALVEWSRLNLNEAIKGDPDDPDVFLRNYKPRLMGDLLLDFETVSGPNMEWPAAQNVVYKNVDGAELLRYFSIGDIRNLYKETTKRERELGRERGAYRYRVNPPWRSSITRELLPTMGVTPEQMKLLEQTDAPIWFYFPKAELLAYIRMVWGERVKIKEAFDPDDPEAFIKRFKPVWKLLSHVKNHHFYFVDNSGRVAVADYSMRNQRDPESSDDGLLLLDKTRPITTYRWQGERRWSIPLIQYYGGVGATPKQSSATANKIEFDDLWPKLEPMGFQLQVREADEEIEDPQQFIDRTMGWIDTFLSAGMTPDTSEGHDGQFYKKYECHGFNYNVYVHVRDPKWMTVEQNDALYGTNYFRRVFQYPDKDIKGMVTEFMALDRICTQARTSAVHAGPHFNEKIVDLYIEHKKRRDKWLSGRVKEALDDPEGYIQNMPVYTLDEIRDELQNYGMSFHSDYASFHPWGRWIIIKGFAYWSVTKDERYLQPEFFRAQIEKFCVQMGFSPYHIQIFNEPPIPIEFKLAIPKIQVDHESWRVKQAHNEHPDYREQTQAFDTVNREWLPENHLPPEDEPALNVPRHIEMMDIDKMMERLGFSKRLPSWKCADPDYCWYERHTRGLRVNVIRKSDAEPQLFSVTFSRLKMKDYPVGRFPEYEEVAGFTAHVGELEAKLRQFLKTGKLKLREAEAHDPDDPEALLKAHVEQKQVVNELKALGFEPQEGERTAWLSTGEGVPEVWVKGYRSPAGVQHGVWVRFHGGPGRDMASDVYDGPNKRWRPDEGKPPPYFHLRSIGTYSAALREIDQMMQEHVQREATPQEEVTALQKIASKFSKWHWDALRSMGGHLRMEALGVDLPPEDQPEQNVERFAQHVEQVDADALESAILMAVQEFETRVANLDIRTAQQADKLAADIGDQYASMAGYENGSDEYDHVVSAVNNRASEMFPGLWADYQEEALQEMGGAVNIWLSPKGQANYCHDHAEWAADKVLKKPLGKWPGTYWEARGRVYQEMFRRGWMRIAIPHAQKKLMVDYRGKTTEAQWEWIYEKAGADKLAITDDQENIIVDYREGAQDVVEARRVDSKQADQFLEILEGDGFISRREKEIYKLARTDESDEMIVSCYRQVNRNIIDDNVCNAWCQRATQAIHKTIKDYNDALTDVIKGVKVEESKETVDYPAVYVDGKVFIGPSHYHIMTALEQQGVTFGQESHKEPRHGWWTSAGRYLDSDLDINELIELDPRFGQATDEEPGIKGETLPKARTIGGVQQVMEGPVDPDEPQSFLKHIETDWRKLLRQYGFKPVPHSDHLSFVLTYPDRVWGEKWPVHIYAHHGWNPEPEFEYEHPDPDNPDIDAEDAAYDAWVAQGNDPLAAIAQRNVAHPDFITFQIGREYHRRLEIPTSKLDGFLRRFVAGAKKVVGTETIQSVHQGRGLETMLFDVAKEAAREVGIRLNENQTWANVYKLPRGFKLVRDDNTASLQTRNGTRIGFMAWRPASAKVGVTDRTVEIEHLEVDERYQNRGLGEAMLQQLKAIIPQIYPHARYVVAKTATSQGIVNLLRRVFGPEVRSHSLEQLPKRSPDDWIHTMNRGYALFKLSEAIDPDNPETALEQIAPENILAEFGYKKSELEHAWIKQLRPDFKAVVWPDEQEGTFKFQLYGLRDGVPSSLGISSGHSLSELRNLLAKWEPRLAVAQPQRTAVLARVVDEGVDLPPEDEPSDVIKQHEKGLLLPELERLGFTFRREKGVETIYGEEDIPRWWYKTYDAPDGNTHGLYVYLFGGQTPEVRTNNFNWTAKAWFQHGKDEAPSAPAQSQAGLSAIIRDLDDAMKRSSADSLPPDQEHEAIRAVVQHHRQWWEDTLDYLIAQGNRLPGRMGPGRPA